MCMGMGQNWVPLKLDKIGWFYHTKHDQHLVPGPILTSPRSARNPWHFARGLELAFPERERSRPRFRSSPGSNEMLWKLETEDSITVCGVTGIPNISSKWN